MNFQPALITAVSLALPTFALAEEVSYSFTAPKLAKGQVVQITSEFSAPTGTITTSSNGSEKQGTMTLLHSWTMHREVLETSGSQETKLRYYIPSDIVTSTLTIDGETHTDTTEAALSGMEIFGDRNLSGGWDFSLDAKMPSPEQQQEILEISDYENRDWLPNTPVKIGDSWKFSPKYIQRVVEKDLHNATSSGTMTLLEVSEKAGKKTATLRCDIISDGFENDQNGFSAGARFRCTGTIQIDLDTMIETKTFLDGTLVTGAQENGQRSVVTLPLTIRTDKKIISAASKK
ncbi:hypothetical protein [Persicirhabdus sediminis]|uniref:Uncharacterized protein n=1 Tax=Persicirhabdus sediminis TaxID=454144 RepID=A0A8J7SLH8_9BACT|nr:hypothetical protein [Persicirhabdus sediminis]MBK1792371.1 hypothetical protein [Persicirhabdus sediminis]